MATTQDRQVIDNVPRKLYIGGEWRDAEGGKTFVVEDPASGKPLCEIADAQPGDARAALDAAASAQQAWERHPPRERGEILRRAFEAVTEKSDAFARLMTLEMGKPLADSGGEVTYGSEFFRWFSEEAVRIDGRWSTSPNGSGRLLTMKQAVGPCLLITPWNFPLAMGTRKIGPAIAAGCTMVLKPASATPLTMLALAKVLKEAGLPPGVMNIVTGSSASAISNPLLEDYRLRKLSFTGSTPVGSQLMKQASGNLLRLSMELGGNAPFLVFDDADVDAAVEGALTAKMRNIGQSCVAANRFHVAERVAEEFTTRLAERMSSLKVGRGTDEGVNVGPLISEDQRGKVDELVKDATGKGARIVCGGEIPDGPGYFYPPTVLNDIPDEARLLDEEIFGPVAPVKTFSDEEEALYWANRTEYGLVAYIYTRDLNRAVRVMEDLQVGMVGVNQGMVSNPAAPFGGVKHSGFGREGGAEGIEEYLATKYCALNM